MRLIHTVQAPSTTSHRLWRHICSVTRFLTRPIHPNPLPLFSPRARCCASSRRCRRKHGKVDIRRVSVTARRSGRGPCAVASGAHLIPPRKTFKPPSADQLHQLATRDHQSLLPGNAIYFHVNSQSSNDFPCLKPRQQQTPLSLFVQPSTIRACRLLSFTNDLPLPTPQLHTPLTHSPWGTSSSSSSS